jgi:glycosyltransferase involved in cell wall biosynthesis
VARGERRGERGERVYSLQPIAYSLNMKTLIVIPTADGVEEKCLESCNRQTYRDFEILISKKTPDGRPRHFNIVDSRNEARERALKTEAEFFLLLDSDVVLPKGALAEFTKQPFDILGGWYKLNQDQYNCGKWVADNTLFNLKAVERSVVKVDVIHLGCVFIKRKVLEKVRFRYGDANNVKFFGEENHHGSCVCTMFSIDAQNADYELHMDGDVVCEHLRVASDEW